MLLWRWKFQVKLTAKSANFLTMFNVASLGIFKKQFLIIEQYPNANNAPRALTYKAIRSVLFVWDHSKASQVKRTFFQFKMGT